MTLDGKLKFDIAFPSGAVDAGNLFSINAVSLIMHGLTRGPA